MTYTATKNTAQDVMDSIVANLVKLMEEGAGTWEMPWQKLASQGMPINATTGAEYKGGNVLALYFSGRASNRWATFKQWQSVGAQVRKGEKGTHLIYWNFTKKVDTNGKESKHAFMKSFVVFNSEQVDGDPKAGAETPAETPVEALERLEHADAYFAAVPATVRWEGDRACYEIGTDTVRMPGFNQFKSSLYAYSTLAHELAHWTGHSTRLNREFGKRFGDDAYAAEELCAELSSAFTCARLGIDMAVRQDHASYIAHWISMLKAQPGLLWSIASKAQAATDHIASFSAPVAVIEEEAA